MSESAASAGLRVALLTPCFWPEVFRGSERVVRDIADGLLSRGHHPRVITSHRGRPSRSVEEGLEIVRVPRPPDGRFERRRFEHYLTHLPFSYGALRAGRYDIAHAVFQTDALVAGRFSAATGRPSVFTFMGIPDRPGLTWRRRRLEIVQSAISQVSAVVALSDYAATEFDRTLGFRPRVVSPGVDTDRFRPSPSAPRAEEPTIFCPAPIEEGRKRVRLLIDAFALVRRAQPQARLLLQRPIAAAVAERLQREVPGIELIDAREAHDRLPELYSRAWVTALPAIGEAFGLVLVESMACGTPAVATRDGGMTEIVDRPEVGRLFEGPRDQAPLKALADALLEALELTRDPATADACRARARDYSTDRATEAYLALYRDLLGRRA